MAPFAEKMLYTDGLAARWTGRELGLRTYAPITTLLTSARSVVNSMRMDGLDAAYIGWSLSGQTPAGPVSLVRSPSPKLRARLLTECLLSQQICQTRLKLNLITGRVLELHDTWCVSQQSLDAGAVAHSTAQVLRLAHAAAGCAVIHGAAAVVQPVAGAPDCCRNSAAKSLTSTCFHAQNARVAAANAAAKVDESQSSEQPIYGDPTDPLKVRRLRSLRPQTQQNCIDLALQFFTMQDRTFEDGVQLMLVLAVMYTLVQGLKLTL